jgi:hypothetical protein
MRALCPSCGFHHEVVRVLDDGSGEGHEDVYQVAPQDECARTLLSERDLFEARARFGQEAIVGDDDD